MSSKGGLDLGLFSGGILTPLNFLLSFSKSLVFFRAEKEINLMILDSGYLLTPNLWVISGFQHVRATLGLLSLL